MYDKFPLNEYLEIEHFGYLPDNIYNLLKLYICKMDSNGTLLQHKELGIVPKAEYYKFIIALCQAFNIAVIEK